MIQELLRTAQSKQKCYADQKAHDLSFMVGKKVLLKVSPMKGIIGFRNRGKLNLRFIGPFDVLERVGEVAYRLALPTSLSGVHPVFHVSMLRRYHADRSHVLDYNIVQLDESLGYEEESIAIVDSQVHKLRSKEISVVKVQWMAQPVEEPGDSTSSRVNRFLQFDPPMFTGTNPEEDSQDFIDEMHRTLRVMRATETEAVELASYRLKEVAYSWFELWKESREEGSPPARWVAFAQDTETHRLRNRIERDGSNKARSAGNFGGSFGGGKSTFRGGLSGPSQSFSRSSDSAMLSGPSQQQQ
ncbi:uncharacterized protein [Nicotiana tomentosiformis]|uniref:uncharacterized protein n=1 Tax=Nicotiana tomentosiformis TaxID=4098 RepID=UPI00388CC066